MGKLWIISHTCGAPSDITYPHMETFLFQSTHITAARYTDQNFVVNYLLFMERPIASSHPLKIKSSLGCSRDRTDNLNRSALSTIRQAAVRRNVPESQQRGHCCRSLHHAGSSTSCGARTGRASGGLISGRFRWSRRWYWREDTFNYCRHSLLPSGKCSFG